MNIPEWVVPLLVPIAFLFGCWTGWCLGTGREPWTGRPPR